MGLRFRSLCVICAVAVVFSCGGGNDSQPVDGPDEVSHTDVDAASALVPDARSDAAPDATRRTGADVEVTAEADAQPDLESPFGCGAGNPMLELPVRVHLLASNLPSFNATISEEGFQAVLDAANTWWQQACIRFVVESFIVDPLTEEQEQAFQAALDAGPEPSDMLALMGNAMPKGNMLSPGWNVMVFRVFEGAPASGVYIAKIQSVLWAEELPPGAPRVDNPPVILAHEFGHSLGLKHYEGPEPENNLMNGDVMKTKETASELTDEQIETARTQALSGSPYLP